MSDTYTDGTYRSASVTHNGYGMPRGPVPTIPDTAHPRLLAFVRCAEKTPEGRVITEECLTVHVAHFGGTMTA